MLVKYDNSEKTAILETENIKPDIESRTYTFTYEEDGKDEYNFETALELTGYGRFNLFMFLLCGSIMMGMTFEMLSVSYLVPSSICELHTTNTEQGLVASMPLAGFIVTSHIWGYLGDTRGRKKILVISMTMSFVAGSLAALSPNWIVLCLLKFVSSASVAGAFALSMAFLSECTPMAKRSSLVILTTSIFLAASGTMAIIVIPVLPLKFSYYIPGLNIYFNSWRVLCLMFAFPSAISALGVSFSYESPKYLLSVGKNEEALEVLKGIYAVNNRRSSHEYSVDVVVLDEDSIHIVHKGFFRSIFAQTVPMLKPPLLKYTILLSTLFVLSYICINSFMVWVPFIVNAFMTSVQNGTTHLTVCDMIRNFQNSTMVKESTNCTMNNAAMIIVFGINIILATLNVGVSGLLSCLGRKTLFIGIQLVAGLAAFGVNSSPYWILTACLFLIFMSGIFNFGFLTTFCVDIYPTYVRAMAVCLTLMVGRGSAVLGINILKQLLDNHCEYVFYIFGTVTCLGGFIGFLLPSDEKIFKNKKMLKHDA